jgi:hypothetical protein
LKEASFWAVILFSFRGCVFVVVHCIAYGLPFGLFPALGIPLTHHPYIVFLSFIFSVKSKQK